MNSQETQWNFKSIYSSGHSFVSTKDKFLVIQNLFVVATRWSSARRNAPSMMSCVFSARQSETHVSSTNVAKQAVYLATLDQYAFPSFSEMLDSMSLVLAKNSGLAPIGTARVKITSSD